MTLKQIFEYLNQKFFQLALQQVWSSEFLIECIVFFQILAGDLLFMVQIYIYLCSVHMNLLHCTSAALFYTFAINIIF